MPGGVGACAQAALKSWSRACPALAGEQPRLATRLEGAPHLAQVRSRCTLDSASQGAEMSRVRVELAREHSHPRREPHGPASAAARLWDLWEPL